MIENIDITEINCPSCRAPNHFPTGEACIACAAPLGTFALLARMYVGQHDTVHYVTIAQAENEGKPQSLPSYE